MHGGNRSSQLVPANQARTVSTQPPHNATRENPNNVRAFLGTAFRLRVDIQRDSVTPGLNGTICKGCGPRGPCLCGIYTFPWSAIVEFVRGAFARARGFTSISRDRGIFGGLRLLCGAPDAFTHLMRKSVPPNSFVVGFGGEL